MPWPDNISLLVHIILCYKCSTIGYPVKGLDSQYFNFSRLFLWKKCMIFVCVVIKIDCQLDWLGSRSRYKKRTLLVVSQRHNFGSLPSPGCFFPWLCNPTLCFPPAMRIRASPGNTLHLYVSALETSSHRVNPWKPLAELLFFLLNCGCQILGPSNGNTDWQYVYHNHQREL